MAASRIASLSRASAWAEAARKSLRFLYVSLLFQIMPVAHCLFPGLLRKNAALGFLHKTPIVAAFFLHTFGTTPLARR